MLSMMVPSSAQKMMLLCLPMISTTRFLRQRSPISFKCSIVKCKMRSRPGWEMFTMRPLAMCLRSSMQKPGALIGLGLFVSVR